MRDQALTCTHSTQFHTRQILAVLSAEHMHTCALPLHIVHWLNAIASATLALHTSRHAQAIFALIAGIMPGPGDLMQGKQNEEKAEVEIRTKGAGMLEGIGASLTSPVVPAMQPHEPEQQPGLAQLTEGHELVEAEARWRVNIINTPIRRRQTTPIVVWGVLAGSMCMLLDVALAFFYALMRDAGRSAISLLNRIAPQSTRQPMFNL